MWLVSLHMDLTQMHMTHTYYAFQARCTIPWAVCSNLNQDNSTRTDMWAVMAAKLLVLCIWGGVLLPTRPPWRFSYSVAREAVESRTTSWAEPCVEEKSTPHWFKGFEMSLSFGHLDMIEFASVSQAWLVGGVGDTEGWRVLHCYPTRHICRGKQIWHRWSVWQEKDMATRQEKQMEKPIHQLQQIYSAQTLIKCAVRKRQDATFKKKKLA